MHEFLGHMVFDELTNQQKFDLAVFLNACWQVQNFQTKEKFP